MFMNTGEENNSTDWQEDHGAWHRDIVLTGDLVYWSQQLEIQPTSVWRTTGWGRSTRGMWYSYKNFSPVVVVKLEIGKVSMMARWVVCMMANGMCMMAGVHDSLTRWWLMAWWSMGMMANEYDIWYYQFRMVDGFWWWTNGRMEEGIFANLCRITFVTEKCEKTDGNFCPKHRSPHPVRKKVKKNKMSQAFCSYEFFVGLILQFALWQSRLL